MALQCREGPFVAHVTLLSIFVVDEALVLLVDAVVGQVRELSTFEIGLVGLACESDKAFVVDVHLQRIDTCHEHVHSNVELVSVDKERSRQVLAHDVLLSVATL